MEQGKVCKECNQYKSLNEFYIQKTGYMGCYSKCKECIKNKQRERDSPRNKKECIFCKCTFIGTPKMKWCSEKCKEQYQSEKRKQNYSYVRKTEKKFDENGRECSKCKEYKTWDNYNRDSSGTKGYCKICKNCNRLSYNPEINRIRGLRYRKNNHDKEIQRYKRYRESEQGRETIYIKNMKRRSNKNNVRFTYHKRKLILDRDNWTCQCCGIEVHDRHTDWNTPNKAHIDHIIPISKGGNSEPDNLQALCRTCNLSKSDKLNLEYINQTQISK